MDKKALLFYTRLVFQKEYSGIKTMQNENDKNSSDNGLHVFCLCNKHYRTSDK